MKAERCPHRLAQQLKTTHAATDHESIQPCPRDWHSCLVSRRTCGKWPISVAATTGEALLSAAELLSAAHQRPQVFQVVMDKYLPGRTFGRVRMGFIVNKGVAVGDDDGQLADGHDAGVYARGDIA